MSLLTKSSDSDAGHSSSKSNSDTLLNIDQMNAAPVRYQQSVVPHMMGGEVYLHTWEVINNGTLPWNSDTELQFTWGSASLDPVERIVPCPPLKPGESGSISVLLNVPKICGQYESYWYFHHKGRKFGHWLGCQIIVDKVNSPEPLSNSFLNSYEQLKSRYNSESMFLRTEPERRNYCNISAHDSNIFEDTSKVKLPTESQSTAMQIPIIEEKMKDLQIAEASGSENSRHGHEENSHDEYIFVTRAPCTTSSNDVATEEITPAPQAEIEPVILNTSTSKIQIVEKYLNELDSSNKSNLEETTNDFKEPNQNKQIDMALESDDNNNNTEGVHDSSSESISKIDEDATSNSTLNDMVMVNFVDEMEDNVSGYAYVLVDGIKVPIPKRYLRSDFLETAEDAPDPSKFIKVNGEQDETISSLEIIQNAEIKLMKEENLLNDSEKREKEVIQETIPAKLEQVVIVPKEPTPIQVEEVSYNFLCEEAKKINESMNCAPNVSSSHSVLVPSTEMQNSDAHLNPRVFVFPQSSPGYEYIPNPELLANQEALPEYMRRGTSSQYAFTNDSSCNKFMKCNIYKQDTSDTNLRQEPQPILSNAPQPQHNPNLLENNVAGAFAAYPENTWYPQTDSNLIHVPNYQQTLPEHRPKLKKEEHPKPEPPQQEPTSTHTSSGYSFTCSSGNTYSTEPTCSTQRNTPAATTAAPMASVVSGAMTMASSALNTAKNVVNMIIPPRAEHEPGVWMNGHWVGTSTECPREANLQALAEMGFWDRDLNATLLARYNDDIAQVVADLIQ